MTYGNAKSSTIAEEMKRDPKIIYFCEGRPSKTYVDVAGWERVKCAGISEHQIIGAGVGAALAGVRTIADCGQIDFVLDAWNQLINQAGKIRFKLAYKVPCPVVFPLTFGNYHIASLHHTSRCHHWLANAPGLFVVVPSSSADMVGLWRTVLRDIVDPTIMLADGMLNGSATYGVPAVSGLVPGDDYKIPFGVADIKREGKDVTIAAIGYYVHMALEVAEDLAKEGIDVEVWDPRTLTPFDKESLVDSVRKTGAMVVVDSAPKTFGATGEFFATVAEALTPVPPMTRVAAMDAAVSWSITLGPYVLPSKAKIIAAVKGVLDRKG